MRAETLKKLSLAGSAAAFASGAAAVSGWCLHVPLLRSWLPGLTPERINAAAGIIFSALALALLNAQDARAARKIAGRLCAVLAALIGLLTLVEYAVGINLGIDDFLFTVRSAEPGNPYPCRMSPVTAMCLTFIGTSLLFLEVNTKSAAIVSEILAVTVQLCSGLGLIGYWYGVSAFYRVSAYSSISLPSIVGSALLAAGILMARPTRGFVGVLSRNTDGSLVARRMLLAAVLVPLILGWLQLRGEKAGLYELEFGTAMLVTVLITFFSALVWWTAVTLDRTDLNRREAEQSLRESEERFRVLFEQSPIGKFLIDPATERIVDCNDRAAEALGYTREELCRLRVPDIDAQLPSEEVTRLIRETAERGTSFSFESAHRTKSGKIRDVMISAARVRVKGRVFNYAAVQDITDRKQAEEALLRAQEQLRQHADTLEKTVTERTAKLNETLQELEAFSYSIAHDMRAPLRAMQGFATILEDEQADRLDATARSYLQRIRASAHRLDQLIHDVLSYSRIVRSDLQLQEINPQQLLEEIIATYPDFQPPKAEISCVAPLPRVRANTAALTQVFSNLLGNAVKFVRPGVKPVVKIRAENREKFVRVWIEDNGIGIEKGAEQQIFQMFQRLNSPGSYEGTGIGLAIVRKAVERMGGKAGVESEPGIGSRFWFELRAAK